MLRICNFCKFDECEFEWSLLEVLRHSSLVNDIEPWWKHRGINYNDCKVKTCSLLVHKTTRRFVCEIHILLVGERIDKHWEGA